jgi:hypothetical protein
MSDHAAVAHAEAAYEAVRALNHATVFTRDGLPEPVVYRVLGFLQDAGGEGLAQALGQVSRALERSLSTYQVYEDDGADPAGSVAAAVAAISEAMVLARRVGRLLDGAQAAISRQGYRPVGEWE